MSLLLLLVFFVVCLAWVIYLLVRVGYWNFSLLLYWNVYLIWQRLSLQLFGLCTLRVGLILYRSVFPDTSMESQKNCSRMGMTRLFRVLVLPNLAFTWNYAKQFTTVDSDTWTTKLPILKWNYLLSPFTPTSYHIDFSAHLCYNLNIESNWLSRWLSTKPVQLYLLSGAGGRKMQGH